MKRKLLVADLFCGAGGSSTGAQRALRSLGLEMDLVCVNHWPTAIETHQLNHPSARHHCVDLDTVNPMELVPEGRLDLLMASPECTHFSQARGGRPMSNQSRMSAWHVNRWCTALDVRCIIVENVTEFQSWGPLDETGRPIKRERGRYFIAWVESLRALGYAVEWDTLCAANYGDATTRRRLFVMARKDGWPIRWPARTHRSRLECEPHAEELPLWRSAREIIQWEVRGQSIFKRPKPLAPKTLMRIIAGGMRVGWWQPFLVILRRHMDGISIDEPVPTITASGNHIAIAERTIEPVLVNMKGQSTGTTFDDPAPTITAHARHLAIAQPVIAPYYGSGSGATCSSVGDPLPTITAKARFGLVEPTAMPIVLGQQSGAAARSVDDPVPTIATAGSISITWPIAEPFVTAYYGDKHGRPRASRSVDEPLATQGTQNRFGIVEPVIRQIDEDEYTLAVAQGRIVEIDGTLYILDILFRMFFTLELARAMSFSDAEHGYEFVGTKENVTRQIGNAVPVRTASALVAALMGGEPS